MDTYYDDIAEGYDELHKVEQLKKLAIIKKELTIEKNMKLLDVGCGTGVSSDFNCHVTGIDPSKKLIEIAKRNFPEKTFIEASAEHIPFENESFDIVISLTAIQNFANMTKGLAEIKRVGKREFALTFLKKSTKSKQIEKEICKLFSDKHIKKIAEDKDIILIIKE